MPDPKAGRNAKAQTTMFLIVLVIIIFAALFIFLLSIAQTSSNEEYMNIYTSSLLLSLSRADTGYLDSNCKTLGDLFLCIFAPERPDWRCGGSGPSCSELANLTVEGYMNRFDMLRENYRYLFIVEPVDFIADRFMIGDASLEDSMVDKISREKIIQRVSGGNEYNIRLMVIIARK